MAAFASASRPPDRPISVFLADDSFTYRMYLRELIDAQDDMAVVGESGNGLSAVQRVMALTPDVVIMDVNMPGLDGVDAMHRIEGQGNATRVILVSACRSGSVEVVAHMPTGIPFIGKANGAQPGWTETLLAEIRNEALFEAKNTRDRLMAGEPISAVLIGASAGGPQAVAKVLTGLPDPMPAAVLMVIHLGNSFGEPMAAWLCRETGRPVRLARDGDRLDPNTFLLAPEGVHMTVVGDRVKLANSASVHNVRPAVDMLFKTAAQCLGARAMAVLLTGMGADGAQGLLALKNCGATTVAQDEATSAVYGMPGQAVALNAAGQVLPLPWISAAVANQLGGPE